MKPHSRLRLWLGSSASAIALVSLTSLYGATASAQDSSSSPVTVYKHVNFRGRSLSVGEGDVSIRTIRNTVGNDRISSIRVSSGYGVYACQHSNFRGRCETFTNDTNDLRDISFNDDISSFRVSRTTSQPVTLFQHVNFRGNSLNVGEGDVTIGDLRNSSVGNDRISSIRVAPGYKVRACQHSRSRGHCQTFTNDTSDLRDVHFNDVISSLWIGKVVVDPVDPPVDPVDPPVDPVDPPVDPVDPPVDPVDPPVDPVDPPVDPVDPPANIPPSAPDNALTLNAGDVVNSLVSGITDSDGPDESLVVAIIGRDATLAGVVGVTNQTLTFDAQEGFNELLTTESETQIINYQVTDEDGAISTGTITLTIQGTVPPAPVAPTFEIGDTGPGGGIVFQVSEDGTSGLEYAPDIFTNLAWGCKGPTGINATSLPRPSNGIDAASGAISSAAIEAALTGACVDFPAPAAQQAFNYETNVMDWYLPSTDELILIRDTFPVTNSEAAVVELPLFDTNGPNTGGNSYWSSTEASPQNAFVVNVGGSGAASADKVRLNNVLPVRTFTPTDCLNDDGSVNDLNGNCI